MRLNSGAASAASLARPSHVLEVHLLDQLTHEVFGQRHARFRRSSNPRAPSRRDQRVGIVALGQEHEFELAPVARERQRVLERAPGGLETRGVAVEAKDQLARQPKILFRCSWVVAVPSVATA